jgi:hypothetical protein
VKRGGVMVGWWSMLSNESHGARVRGYGDIRGGNPWSREWNQVSRMGKS